MKSSTMFLSCDWGTSSFRLRLVNSGDYKVIAERVSKEGNARTFENWSKSGRAETDRISFYTDILRGHISELGKDQGRSLDGLPLIISGMASSTIGMLELPYKPLPFNIDGSDLHTHKLDQIPGLKNEIYLISGVKTDDDVMRGEETQLVGCMLNDQDTEQLFIHPGTHSKHVRVKNGQAVSFETYMTGELFSILSKESILASSVEQGDDLRNPANLRSFEKGVKDSSAGNLLHLLFMVRTNDLFNKLAPAQNFFYLSGLLIATELASFPEEFNGKVILAGEQILVDSYQKAIEILGIDNRISELSVRDAEEITIRGQFQIIRRLA